MVHFVMDDCKDLQRLGDGQSSICVVIITVCLLHVHMLEIVHLMCCIGLCPHRVCISKAFQLLAFGTTGNVRPNPPPLSVLVRVMVLRITCIVCVLEIAHFTSQGIHVILNHFVY